MPESISIENTNYKYNMHEQSHRRMYKSKKVNEHGMEHFIHWKKAVSEILLYMCFN